MMVTLNEFSYSRWVVAGLFSVIIISCAGHSAPVRSEEGRAIFHWDNLKCTGYIDSSRFNNGFGILTVNEQGLEHRGFHTATIDWNRIRSVRLDKLENLISIELQQSEEKWNLTTMIGHSRYQFERIYLHLQRLHRRFAEKDGPTPEEDRVSARML